MSDKVLTPVGRFSFCSLFEPKKQQRKRKGVMVEEDVYELTLILDLEADLTDLKRICAQAKEEFWKGKPPAYVKSPFRQGVQKSDQHPNGYDLTKYPEYEGKIIISARSVKVPPGVVDANRQTILDAKEVYSGCYGRMSVVAFGYDNEGGQGITFGLQNVQKIKDGEPLGSKRGKAEDDFDAFEPATVGDNYDLLGV